MASEICSKHLEFVTTDEKDGGVTTAETKAESKSVHPAAAPEIAQRRNKFSPEISDAFEKSSKAAFSAGALS